MASVIKNSHYISRFLLRNWEHPERGTLALFDFRDGTLSTDDKARETFVSPTPLPRKLERWLSDNIESPLGAYLARCKETHARQEPSDLEWRAIRLAILAQVGRTAHARDVGNDLLEELASSTPERLEQLLAASHHVSRTCLAFTEDQLFFPDAGLVAFPMVGAISIFLPLHPNLYALSIPRLVPEGAAEEMIAYEGIAAAVSVGLQGDIIVVPPVRDDVDRGEFAEWLRQSRARARRLCELQIKSNREQGFELADAWTIAAGKKP